MIGVFAEPAITGKPLGSDIKAGKRTLLVQLALERASVRQLRHAIGVLESSGARRLVERRIDTLSRQALGALDKQRVNARGRELLQGAVRMLVERSC